MPSRRWPTPGGPRRAAKELCDWLATAALTDGGLPFARPVTDPTGVAPFWASADESKSSLLITAYVAAAAHRGKARRGRRKSPWLATATDYCLQAIAALEDPPFALVLNASLQLADAIYDEHLEAVERVGRFIPASGHVPVTGGASRDDAPAGPRALPRPAGARAHRGRHRREGPDRVGEQQDDGGWVVDFRSYSPAAELEWRGYATVRAVQVLRANGAG